MIYLSGFAFTASPGKLGELVRLRYLRKDGEPAETAIAEFFYERLFDLVTVLLLSTLAIGHLPGLGLAAGFVAIVTLGVIVLAIFPGWLQCAADIAQQHKLPLVATALSAFALGMTGVRRWVNLRDVATSLAFSFASWITVSFGFVCMLVQMQIDVGQPLALAIYPLASLVGAASILPGGLGSTELATVASLTLLGAPLATATLVTLGFRLATLWFAMLLGVSALTWLESYQ